MKPNFCKVLATVPGFPVHKVTHKYQDICKATTQYILGNKERVIPDKRNIRVAYVKDDLLGKAFNVTAFHRTELASLIRTQLIPLNG